MSSTQRGAKLDELIALAAAWFDALTPAEQEAHRREQRASWARGEMAIGSDADEARSMSSTQRISENAK